MSIFLRLLIFIFNIIKAACIIFALVYLLGLGLMFINEHLFNTVNACVGFLPSYFSQFIDIKIDFIEQTSATGYILSFLFFVFLLLLSIIGERYAFEMLREYVIYESEQKIKKITVEHYSDTIKNLKLELKIYCGLYEFVFQGKDSEKLQDLKNKYNKVLIGRLQYKYKDNFNYVINKNNQIEFTCNDFSKFDMIIDDLLKCYSALRSINATEGTLAIKFSICSKQDMNDTKKIFKLLSKINRLNYINKVIVNRDIVVYSNNSNFTRFEFATMGITKLDNDHGKDLDIELFRLFNPSVSKGNNK